MADILISFKSGLGEYSEYTIRPILYLCLHLMLFRLLA